MLCISIWVTSAKDQRSFSVLGAGVVSDCNGVGLRVFGFITEANECASGGGGGRG